MQKITREIKLLEPHRVYDGEMTFDPIVSFTQNDNIYDTHIVYQDDLFHILREFQDGTIKICWIYPAELILLMEVFNTLKNIEGAVDKLNSKIRFDKFFEENYRLQQV